MLVASNLGIYEKSNKKFGVCSQENFSLGHIFLITKYTTCVLCDKENMCHKKQKCPNKLDEVGPLDKDLASASSTPFVTFVKLSQLSLPC